MYAITVLFAIGALALRLIPDPPLAETASPPTPSASSPNHGSPSPAAPGPAPAPPADTDSPLAVHAGPVSLDVDGWWSWALLDRRTGIVSGSANSDETSTTASLIKAWIAADYLRGFTQHAARPSAAQLHQVSIMIRDSDNEAAESLYTQVGRVAAIERLVSICGLTDSSPASDGGWSRTNLSPRDITLMGACIVEGRAAGAEWTHWLLNELRNVRGYGDFGIRKAFPKSVQHTIAIKNGWVERTPEQETHVSCLAIGDGWVAAVMTRYPISYGYDYGAKVCEGVGRQLHDPQTGSWQLRDR